jgi:hypothetical protein
MKIKNLLLEQEESLLNLADYFYQREQITQSSLDLLAEAWAEHLDKVAKMELTKQIVTAYVEAFQSVGNAITTIQQNEYRKRIDGINEVYDTEKKRIEGSVMSNKKRERELAKIETTRKTAADKAAKEEGNRYKGWAIAMASISAAAGIMAAWGTSEHWAVKLGHSITIAAALVTQISNISAQKFAKGGIAQGPSTGDQVNARVNGGEMILTKTQQANLFAMANGKGNASQSHIYMGDTIIQGSIDSATLDKLNERDSRNQEAMKRMLRQMQFNGTISKGVLA